MAFEPFETFLPNPAGGAGVAKTTDGNSTQGEAGTPEKLLWPPMMCYHHVAPPLDFTGAKVRSPVSGPGSRREVEADLPSPSGLLP